MALYLIHRTREEDRNSSGINAVIVNADNEAAARAAANAALPGGETHVPATWGARDLSTLPENKPLWIEGDAVSLLGFTRGGQVPLVE